MLNIGNKTYRNIQEQVAYNTSCIKKLDEYLDGITIEDKLVVIESDSGTFTDEELLILSGPLAFISDGSKVWIKQSETLLAFVFKAIDIVATEESGTHYSVGGSKITIDRETGVYNTSTDTIITLYNKDQIDSLLSLKADSTALTAGLALKADLSGANFTGNVNINADLTANSIIENMSGYSFDPVISTTREYIYVGAVKNGNKLTLTVFFAFTPASNISPGTGSKFGDFHIPSSVGQKLYPFTIGTLTNTLDIHSQKVPYNLLAESEITVYTTKTSNTSLYMALMPNDELVAGRRYLIRYEVTFLLSNNLAA